MIQNLKQKRKKSPLYLELLSKEWTDEQIVMEIATRVGVSTRTIHRWENNETINPHEVFEKRLKKVLEIK